MHTHSEVVTIVNEVIETLNERESGYRIATENAKHTDAAKYLTDYVAQSSKFIAELMPYSDEDSPKEIGKGSLGTIYQGFMNIKEKITGGNTKSILGDCLAGEEAAIKVYEGALKDDEIPVDLRQILEQQYGEIKVAQESIRNLREMIE